MIRSLVLLVLLQACASTPMIVEEEKNEQPTEIVVSENAVDVAEVMALKEVLEKVVDLQKKEGEE